MSGSGVHGELHPASTDGPRQSSCCGGQRRTVPSAPGASFRFRRWDWSFGEKEAGLGSALLMAVRPPPPAHPRDERLQSCSRRLASWEALRRTLHRSPPVFSRDTPDTSVMLSKGQSNVPAPVTSANWPPRTMPSGPEQLCAPSCRLGEAEQVTAQLAPHGDSQGAAAEDSPAQVCLPFCLFADRVVTSAHGSPENVPHLPTVMFSTGDSAHVPASILSPWTRRGEQQTG